MHRPQDAPPVEPTEAWVQTDDIGEIYAITVGVWENPDAWIDCAPEDLLVDPDGMAAHPEGGDRA